MQNAVPCMIFPATPRSNAFLRQCRALHVAKLPQHVRQCAPPILVLVPVCPLGSTDFSDEHWRGNLARCALEIRPQTLPKPVTDLCSGLNLYTFATWEFVFIHFGVVRLHPDILATLQDLLLLVDDIVVRMLVGGSWGGVTIYIHTYIVA